MAYSEQVGEKRQLGPNKGLIANWYPRIILIATFSSMLAKFIPKLFQANTELRIECSTTTAFAYYGNIDGWQIMLV